MLFVVFLSNKGAVPGFHAGPVEGVVQVPRKF